MQPCKDSIGYMQNLNCIYRKTSMVFREPFVLHGQTHFCDSEAETFNYFVTESVSQAVTTVLIETVIQATAPHN